MSKTFIKVFVVVLMFYSIFTVKTIQAQAPDRKLQEFSNRELITYFAEQYQVSEKQLLGVMMCESGGNQKAVGDGGRARGIYQYHQPTWEAFSKRFGEELNRESSYDQVKLTAWAFSKGLQYHWTCFKIKGYNK